MTFINFAAKQRKESDVYGPEWSGKCESTGGARCITDAWQCAKPGNDPGEDLKYLVKSGITCQQQQQQQQQKRVTMYIFSWLWIRSINSIQYFICISLASFDRLAVWKLWGLKIVGSYAKAEKLVLHITFREICRSKLSRYLKRNFPDFLLVTWVFFLRVHIGLTLFLKQILCFFTGLHEPEFGNEPRTR